MILSVTQLTLVKSAVIQAIASSLRFLALLYLATSSLKFLTSIRSELLLAAFALHTHFQTVIPEFYL